ncbi:MAG: hypothetical protein HLUCCA08_16460 [Rhodobacteraceae bacterium HLUCCA08]|nr:MAG: hypothetical protein HLUCCA08_16460 [Rhodobacteraceae bacterium HLUCCA08]
MSRLALVLYVFLSATLAGSFMVAALVAGLDTTRPVVISALLGFIIAIPVSIAVARKLS